MNSKVKIIISGKNPDYFVKRYIFNKIIFYNYKLINHNSVSMVILYDDYLKLIKIKSIYKINIDKLYGMKKYEYIFRKYYVFIISLIISIIFLFIISNVIFEIDIVHNDKNIRKLVSENLNDYGIKKYRIIPSFNKRKKIINNIINKNKETIEWMEMERKGSKIIVKITERRKNKKEEDNGPRHIIAKKSGVITKIEATSGVILKKKNDYVSKGDIIISGDVIKDETVKGQVKAKGLVYAEVWYKVNVTYPLKYKEVVYLDDVKNNLVFSFINKNISLRKGYENFSNERKFVLIKNKIFPISVNIEKQRKVKIINKKYKKEDAILLATKLAESNLKNKLDKTSYIVSKKTLNLNLYNSKIEVDVFFKVNENITDYKKVDTLIINEE